MQYYLFKLYDESNKWGICYVNQFWAFSLAAVWWTSLTNSDYLVLPSINGWFFWPSVLEPLASSYFFLSSAHCLRFSSKCFHYVELTSLILFSQLALFSQWVLFPSSVWFHYFWGCNPLVIVWFVWIVWLKWSVGLTLKVWFPSFLNSRIWFRLAWDPNCWRFEGLVKFPVWLPNFTWVQSLGRPLASLAPSSLEPVLSFPTAFCSSYFLSLSSVKPLSFLVRIWLNEGWSFLV